MTPFLQFRVWLRRGPVGERVPAAIAAVLGIALLVWALVPVEDDDEALLAGDDLPTLDTTDTTSGSAAPDEPGDRDGDGTAAGTGSSNGDGGSTTGTAPSGGSGGVGGGGGTDPCANLRATDRGVTATDILIAVPLINLAGDIGNDTFDIRPDLEQAAQAAAAGINADGGVACRKLKVKTYRVNPFNPEEQRANCLDIVRDKAFAVIEFGAYLDPVSRACFVENKIPFQSALAITEDEARTSYPYMYTASASADRQLRSWVYAAAARGTFKASKGFEKLGLMLFECEEAEKINSELLRNLNSVGVSRSEMSIFYLSCVGAALPNQLAQAMAQHRTDGATHVLLSIAQLNAQQYVSNADQIDYEPVYVASDYGAITTTTAEGDWSDGFDGTVAFTSLRGGELNSGVVHPLVRPCQTWYRKGNVKPPTTDGDSAFFFCTFFRLFQAAGNAVGPNLTRAALLPQGLARIGRFQSATHGDTTFDKTREVTGGDQIRAIQWRLSCRCWKVLTRDWQNAR